MDKSQMVYQLKTISLTFAQLVKGHSNAGFLRSSLRNTLLYRPMSNHFSTTVPLSSLHNQWSSTIIWLICLLPLQLLFLFPKKSFLTFCLANFSFICFHHFIQMSLLCEEIPEFSQGDFSYIFSCFLRKILYEPLLVLMALDLSNQILDISTRL